MTGKFERHYGYVTQIICPDLQTAQYKASEEMMNTSGYVLPVVVFWQGERFTMTGALPFNYVQSRLSMRSASARASIDDVNQALNRPEIPEHSDGIAKYLLDNYNKKYILPPMTLNVQEQVRLYSVDYYNARFYPGFLVIPPTSMIAITDGQHRSRGIIRALERLSEQQRATLEHDSIAVMITCESNLDQIHQDFADCSKTKLIPQSLLAVYDRRNPANRLVIDIERLCPLFNGKVDATGKKIGSKSTLLFTTNQIRQFVKSIMLGSWAVRDSDFERRARERLNSEAAYSEYLQLYVDYINIVTANCTVMDELSRLNSAVEAARIPERRAEGWVCLTVSGLVVIGAVGHVLVTHGLTHYREYAARLGRIDWRRSAGIWQGKLVNNNRIITSAASVRQMLPDVLAEIGWQASPPKAVAVGR